MNRKIRKYRAIKYIILCYAAVLMLLIGPLGIFDGSREVSGNENVQGKTAAVTQDARIQQVFIGDGGYLEKISIYAIQNLSRRVVSLTVSDELGETVFSRRVALDTYEAPGFFTIPVEFQTVQGRAYVWEISHPEEAVELGYQQTADAGIGVYGNYYFMGSDQKIDEQVGNNIIMRFQYADKLSFLQKAAILFVIALAAGFSLLLVENHARKRKITRDVKVQWVFKGICNPLITAGAIAGIAAVYPFAYYGGVKADKMVYTAGILVMAALLLYVVNAKRDSIAPLLPPLKETVLDRGMDWLQCIFWAGALWGCIDYVNAMYNIYQDYAYRKVLIYLCLVLLTMCGKKALFHWGNLIWLAVSAVAGYLYYRPFRGIEEQDKLAMLNAILFAAAGLVLIQLVIIIWKKKTAWKQLSPAFTVLVAAFFVLLLVFRNTRGWPVYMVTAFTLLYIFYLSWEKKERFLGILCNGIILNFFCALVFAVLRRPFRAWGYYRYNFVFHTVTVTAAYLTLVICALFVKLLMQYHKSRRLHTYWTTALMFGMAVSFLLMTMSRTGYLAAVAMGIVVLLFVSLLCYRERFLSFLGKTGLLVLLILLSFPVTYSAVRLIPPLYDDPYIFELEANEEEWAVHKGDKADSENYITFPRFAYCIDVKLFGEEHSIVRKFVDTFMADSSAESYAPGEDRLEVNGMSVMLASSQETEIPELAPEGEQDTDADTGDSQMSADGPSDEEDYSNGRFEIFKRYISHWNLTGHDEMGVELPDGSLSVHAHNTYLQVIHDHGLITGAVYLLLGIVSLIQMFRYALTLRQTGRLQDRENPRDDYAALPLAVFLAFAVAGLVEWLFHPCNPLGFTTMAVLAPLLTFRGKKKKRVNENEG